MDLTFGGAVSDALPVAMAVFRPTDLVVLYTNYAWDELFGYEHGAVIGQSIEVVGGIDDEAELIRVRAAVRAEVGTGGTWHGRVRKRRRSGEEFWSMTHIASYDHEEYGQVWVSLQTGDELPLGEIDLDIVGRLAGLGTWEFDTGDGFIHLSAQGLRLLGATVSSEPMPLPEIVAHMHPTDLPRVVEVLHGADAGIAPDFSCRVMLEDGAVRHLHIRGTKVHSSASGHLYRGVILDTTASHPSADVLDGALADEGPHTPGPNADDEAKNLLLRAVSHDLRTPLTIMEGFASILVSQDERLTEADRRYYAERIEAGAQRLQRQLNDLLDLDRLSRGVLMPLRHPTDLRRLAADCVEALDLAHRVAVDGDTVIADVDPAQVERIVENLLSNAVRHTPADCPIELRVEYVPDGVLISVDDHGPGVDADQHETVFNVFHKVHPNSSGTGVGLPIVRRFAEVHGGRAWLEDREGGGAAFRIFLPTVGDAPVEE